LDALHRRFLDDQADAALEHAEALLSIAATEAGFEVTERLVSQWVTALIREARRWPCLHAPHRGRMLVIVPAHVRQWLCQSCSQRASRRLCGSLDEARCDVCRQPAALEPFVFQRGRLVVTGRHCEGCTATVYGGAR
jgi:hypothetical protein